MATGIVDADLSRFVLARDNLRRSLLRAKYMLQAIVASISKDEIGSHDNEQPNSKGPLEAVGGHSLGACEQETKVC